MRAGDREHDRVVDDLHRRDAERVGGERDRDHRRRAPARRAAAAGWSACSRRRRRGRPRGRPCRGRRSRAAVPIAIPATSPIAQPVRQCRVALIATAVSAAPSVGICSCAAAPARTTQGSARPMRSAPATSTHRRAGAAADRGQVGEAVDQAGVAAQRDLDAGLAHPQRVGLALVAQRVEAGGGDVGGRQAARSAASRTEARGSAASVPSGR